MDQLRILELLNENSDKPFVNRLLNARDYPALPNRDGSSSTHSMAMREADGRYFVYPEVVYDDEMIMRLGPDTAFGRALRMGDFIEFDNEQDAYEFSREYKKAVPFFGESEVVSDVVYPKRKTIWKDLNTGPGTVSDGLGD